MNAFEQLIERAYACLMLRDPQQKAQAVLQLAAEAPTASELAQCERPSGAAQAIEVPGRPDAPELVPPARVPRRGLGSVEGRRAFFHALCHIEFNAINLALDALYRFRQMPSAYYLDWLRVAREEAEHFEMLCAHLDRLGTHYGALPAHNNLWEMACRTEGDVMARMALVPRLIEARGLDVAPAMIERLARFCDDDGVAALKVIHREEIEHVRIGNRWYLHCCEQRSLVPRETFFQLLNAYAGVGYLSGPFDRTSRLAAGFDESELDELAALALAYKEQAYPTK